MKPNEQILRKWEKDPMRYKDEIRKLDRQLTDRFQYEMKTKTRYYQVLEYNSP